MAMRLAVILALAAGALAAPGAFLGGADAGAEVRALSENVTTTTVEATTTTVNGTDAATTTTVNGTDVATTTTAAVGSGAPAQALVTAAHVVALAGLLSSTLL